MSLCSQKRLLLKIAVFCLLDFGEKIRKKWRKMLCQKMWNQYVKGGSGRAGLPWALSYPNTAPIFILSLSLSNRRMLIFSFLSFFLFLNSGPIFILSLYLSNQRMIIFSYLSFFLRFSYPKYSPHIHIITFSFRILIFYSVFFFVTFLSKYSPCIHIIATCFFIFISPNLQPQCSSCFSCLSVISKKSLWYHLHRILPIIWKISTFWNSRQTSVLQPNNGDWKLLIILFYFWMKIICMLRCGWVVQDGCSVNGK